MQTERPRILVEATIWGEFTNKPIALQHLAWYLRTGQRRDFVVGANIVGQHNSPLVRLLGDRATSIWFVARIERRGCPNSLGPGLFQTCPTGADSESNSERRLRFRLFGRDREANAALFALSFVDAARAPWSG